MFDKIPHDMLLDTIKERVKDEYILNLLELILKAHNSNHLEEKMGIGILQGGIISPLLLNIYLDQFDDKWESVHVKNLNNDDNNHLIRYADDFVILSKSPIDPIYVEMPLVNIGLEINKEKTYQTTVDKGFEFLGFYFKGEFLDDKYKRKIILSPTDESVTKQIENIQNLILKKLSAEQTLQQINTVIDAWTNYYYHTDYHLGLQKIHDSYSEYVHEYICSP